MKKSSLIILCFVAIFFSTSFVAKQYELNRQAPVGLNLGNQAPEIKQADPTGKIITLSSLKGKLVLIDFWASWCGPCRYENPTVVQAYKIFKDKKFGEAKGLTILSVSLDANAQAWKKAIVDDNLEWGTHVSDLQGWSSVPAAMYGITGIPMNYLVNENGIIIQKNLRGKDLLSALEKLVTK